MSEFSVVKKKQEHVFKSNDEIFGLQERQTDWSEQQMSDAKSLDQQIQQDEILLSVHTADMTVGEMKSAYENSYIEKINTKKASEGSREHKKLKKQVAGKVDNAMDMHKKIMALADDGTDYDAMMKNSFSLQRVMATKDKSMQGLTKTAPLVFERALKLTHAMDVLEYEKDTMSSLYNFAKESLDSAKKEWQRIEELINVPEIDKDEEEKQLAEREKNENELKTVTSVDVEYEVDFMDSVKQRKLYDGKVKTEAEKKKEIPIDPKVLKTIEEQMKKIKAEFPDITEKEIEETVNDYLERIVEKSEFRMRAFPDAASQILQTRARGGKSENYDNMLKKWFSKDTKHTFQQIGNFGYLGGKNAADYVNKNGQEKSIGDTLLAYGCVSIKLDKKKFRQRGFVSFVVGNSLHHYEEKQGRSAEKTQGKPDILSCGKNLYDVFKRAHELKKNDYKDMLSAEQEANFVSFDDPGYRYFEAEYQGPLGTSEMEELTYMFTKNKNVNFKNPEDKKRIRKEGELVKLYKQINIINKNPEKYGRSKEDKKLKLTVWDANGNTISYNELIAIMETKN